MSPDNLLDRRVATAFYGRFSSVRQSQLDVIKPLLNGCNVVLTSGTGSGKTEAVVAPIISRYYTDALVKGELFLVYVSPTKALVNDIEKRLRAPLVSLGLKVGIRHGDRDDLKKQNLPNILITTPESLDVILFRKDPCLRSVKAIILDEVHILYNTQRGLQLSILMKRLHKFAVHDIQWAALSATIADVSHIRDFLLGSDIDAKFFSYPAERNIDCQIRHISHLIEFRQIIERIMEKRNLKLLIFADSRKECERLASSLSDSPTLAHLLLVHYSSLSQQVRVETEKEFSAMDSSICIATSTLELGIDIGDIDAVIIWGTPDSIESFLQRIGRGNRRSNKINVICLVPDTSKAVFIELMKFCVMVECSKKGELPIKAPYELYGAAAQQFLSILASNEGSFIKKSELTELVYHLTYIKNTELDSMLNELSEKEYVKKHDFKYRYAAYENLFKLVDLRLIYGNFSLGSKAVQLRHGAKNLGEVPEINLLKLKKGSIVRFHGKYWRIKKISPDVIDLEISQIKKNPVDFTYPGTRRYTDPFILDRLWKTLNSDNDNEMLYEADIGKFIKSMNRLAHESMNIASIPYCTNHDSIRYYTFGGVLVNRAIALIQDHYEFEADEISLTVGSPIHWDQISDQPIEYEVIFTKLFDKSMQQSIFQMILPLELQLHEYTQFWLKDKAIETILQRLKTSTPIQVNQELIARLGFL